MPFIDLDKIMFSRIRTDLKKIIYYHAKSKSCTIIIKNDLSLVI